MMTDPHITLNEAEFAGLATSIRDERGSAVDAQQRRALESALQKTALHSDCSSRDEFLNRVMTDSLTLNKVLALFSEEVKNPALADAPPQKPKPLMEVQPIDASLQLVEDPIWNGQCSTTQQPCSLAFLLKYLLDISGDWSVNIRQPQGPLENLPQDSFKEGDMELELRNGTGEVLYLLVNTKYRQEKLIQGLTKEQLQMRINHIRLAESEVSSLYQEEKRRVLQLSQLRKLSNELVGIYDPQRVMELAAEKVRDFMGHLTCAVLNVVDRENRKVRLMAKSGFPDQFIFKDDLLLHFPIIDEILETKKPVYRNRDDLQPPRFLKNALMANIQSICAYPILINDCVDSIIVFGRESGWKPQEWETTLTALLTERVAIALENAQLFEEIHQSFQRLASLRSIDQAISTNKNLDSILEVLINQVIQQMNVGAACVLLYKDDSEVLQFRWGKGFAYKKYFGKEFALQTTIAEQAIRVKHTVCYPNIDLRNYPHLSRENFSSVACTPILIQGKVAGVLEVFSKEPLCTSLDWIEYFETLAWQIAIAIDNYELFTGLQRSNQDLTEAYDATIQGWSRALDLRDKETEGHTQRVTEKTLSLARRMHYREDGLVHIRRGALLHDIGKMSIPDRILLKEGPLTDEEWVIMRRHTEFAFELMAPIQYLWPAIDIPYCHHEKWDGSGYPRGLQGEQIPLAARIFSIVDVWDALTSDRPYRKAWSRENAIAYIRSQRGKHFDPQVVDTFLENFSGHI
jgi:HD-GYP domain-containing protein (c-di-GMP phosphodiesterase class II)